MSAWVWLLAAALGGIGSYVAGWPAWTSYRARQERDHNAERYLAWRGRSQRVPADMGMSRRERQRLVVAGLLALVAAFCLVGFFTYT